jgi:hypothetical protein
MLHFILMTKHTASIFWAEQRGCTFIRNFAIYSAQLHHPQDQHRHLYHIENLKKMKYSMPLLLYQLLGLSTVQVFFVVAAEQRGEERRREVGVENLGVAG